MNEILHENGWIKNPATKNPFAPITTTENVYTKNGNRLSQELDNLNGLVPIVEDTSEVVDELKSSITNKLDKNQGADNTGKVITVGEDGLLTAQNIPQADWNVNDEISAAFIKNRPFYTGDPVETFIVEETTFELVDGMGQLTSTHPLEVGQEYVVTLDSTTYNCVCKFHEQVGMSYIGNLGLMGQGEDTGELFFIAPMDSETALGIVINSDVVEHTVSVNCMIGEIFKLDRKYLPSDVILPEIPTNYDAEDYQISIKDGKWEITRPVGINGYAAGAEIFNNYTNNEATGYYSHAEGSATQAKEAFSHTSGVGTIANSPAQYVYGSYNIEDTNELSAPYVAGHPKRKYIHIVGNGTAPYARSNAHTLDWSGNAWFAGDVYVGGTSGTNKDEGSKKLSSEEYVDSLINNKQDKTFVVNFELTDNEDYTGYNVTTSTTFDEVYSAIQEGKTVIGHATFGAITCVLHAETITSSRVCFVCIDENLRYEHITKLTIEMSAYYDAVCSIHNLVAYSDNNSIEATSITLKSPNGTRFSITIGDDGVLSATEITE